MELMQAHTQDNKAFSDIKSSLVSRNITVFGKRTSIRLEPEMWSALRDMARREGCRIHDLCSLVSMRKQRQTSLTAAIRVFIMLYYKAAASEDGHIKAGHGNFEFMKQRARIAPEYLSLLSCSGKKRDRRHKNIAVLSSVSDDGSHMESVMGV